MLPRLANARDVQAATAKGAPLLPLLYRQGFHAPMDAALPHVLDNLAHETASGEKTKAEAQTRLEVLYGPVYADNMQRLVRKVETAQDLVPRPLQANAAKPTKYGVIYFGSTSPAMDEAIGLLEAKGHQLDRLRIRAFPFHSSVASFLAEHDFVYVVEQNRDSQLRQLIVNENGIDPVRLIPIVHYDGTPITARFIAKAIGDHQDHLKVTPLRKAVS